MKKLRINLTGFYSVYVVLVALIIGLSMYFLVSQLLIENLQEYLMESAKQGATTVEVYVTGHLNELEAIASNSLVGDASLSYAERLDELKGQLKLRDFKRISIIDVNGHSKTTDDMELQVGDREYFKKALLGESNVSEPIVSRGDGALSIVFAVPIYYKDKIVGVLSATHNISVLSEITDKIRLGPDGSSFIIDKDGTTVAHDVRTLVYAGDNDFDNIYTDPSLSKLVSLERQMIAGKVGAGSYIYNGMEKYMGFCPIKNTQWFIAVTAPKSQVMDKISKILVMLIIAVLLITVIVIAISTYLNYLKRKLVSQQNNSNRIIEVANVIVLSIKPDGTIISYNSFAEMFFNKLQDTKSIKMKNLFDFLTDDEQLRFHNILNEIKNGKLKANHEPMCVKGMTTRYILWNIGMSLSEGNHIIELIGIDITERIESEKKLQSSYETLSSVYEELAASEEELRTKYDELNKTQDKLIEVQEVYNLAMDGSNDVIWEWNGENKKLFYSDKLCEITGYDRNEIGDTADDLLKLYHPDDVIIAAQANREFFHGHFQYLKYEFRIRTKSGEYKWILIKGKGILNNKGKVSRIAGSFTDISDFKMNEQKINQMAYYDSLTDLPNRFALYQETEKIINQTLLNNTKGAFVYLDLDNFKYVNDSFGHSVGDLLLIEAGKRLSVIERENYFVSRISGDEFIILIKSFKDFEELNTNILMIMDLLSDFYSISGNSFHITVSCGVSVFPDDGTDTNSLLRNADMAMYSAKKGGRNKYSLFKKSMNDEVIEKVKIENGLRKALKENELLLYYQPQIDLGNKHICAFEALIRWVSNKYGFVEPDRFINIAEETRLIVPIGKWVLEAACRFTKSLHDMGYKDLNISVNISAVQLIQPDFVESVLEILNATGLEPYYLELELTETVLIETIDNNLGKLQKLRRNGIKVSIDDFGKGYSSLSYLRQLLVNTLKIDKSFLDDIGNNKNITGAIINIAHKMGLTVIAEGVETKAQLRYLSKSRCNIAQGYLISKPLPESEAIDFISKESPM